jgi:Antibiotic biosynthesis monooxygenase
MTAINVVRFRVKPGMDKAFLEAHREGKANWPGLCRGFLVKTGERSYTLVAEWKDMSAIAAARSDMIGTLDTFRHTLEDLGNGLGVTDPASGEIVLSLK